MQLRKTIIAIGSLTFLINFISCKNSDKHTLIKTNEKDISIPFKLTQYNNIKIKAILNGNDTLNLKFDSGTTGLLLTHKAIREKTNLLKNNTEEDTITYNYVKLKTLASLEIGTLKWEDLEIYPVQHSGQGTDGRFGWDLFKDKVLSIDYDKNLLIVHNELPNTKNFTKSQLEKVETLLCFNGFISINNKNYNSRFLFDTGYQRALLLDSIILYEQSFPKDLNVIKTNQLTNGAGDIFITKVVEIPSLTFGGQTITKFPTQILNRENPAGFKTHILGNELLKRYNTILDFRNRTIYLKKNELFKLPYIDAS